MLELDDHLAGLLSRTREPQLAAIRLAWWRDQLESLGQGTEPSDPLLQKLLASRHRLTDPAALGDLADGWVDLASGGDAQDHGRLRGGGLFAALGGESCRSAGEAWGQTLAGCKGTEPSSELIRTLRRQCLPLAVLAMLARSDAVRERAGRRPLGPFRRMALALGVALKR